MWRVILNYSDFVRKKIACILVRMVNENLSGTVLLLYAVSYTSKTILFELLCRTEQ